MQHRQRVLRHRHQRRHAGLTRSGADPRGGRQAASTSAWRRPSRPTPTTSSTSGIPRATTTPSPGLERIQAALLAINAADDERNPPETGIMERELKRVKNGRLLSDPGQRGHARPRHHRHGEVLEAASCRSCCRRRPSGRCSALPSAQRKGRLDGGRGVLGAQSLVGKGSRCRHREENRWCVHRSRVGLRRLFPAEHSR